MIWKRTVVVLAACAALAAAACRDVTTPQPQSDATIPSAAGRYIVVFRDSVTDAPNLARQLMQATGGSLTFTYSRVLKGFAASLPQAALAVLGRNPRVAYIEPDQVFRADVTQAMDANGDPWGLDRIDQQTEPLPGTYTYTSDGAGVNVYIIDTGIWTLTADSEGRADNVYDAFGLTGEDCHGHGTHVAGIVGGATYGVAKGVSLHGVRVLSCAGVGLTSQIIAGLDWVRQNRVDPAVANMSLGGGLSTALNDATTNLWESGVFVAVAAGHDNAGACQASATVADWIIANATADVIAGNPSGTPNRLLFKGEL